MSTLNRLTAEQIKQMNYNELIGLVRETNRPPGGLKSILEVANKCRVGSESKVLEIGTATGVTAVELGLYTGAQITAIDISEQSLDTARKRAAAHGLSKCISFEQQDATSLPYLDCTFDLVFCGNVTSLIPDRAAALREYTRLLRPLGYLAAIPMYYLRQPSDELVRDVSDAIQVDLDVHDKAYWDEFFTTTDLNIVEESTYTFDHISDEAVDAFCREVLARPHLDALGAEARATLQGQYTDYMFLFRENLAHMGYSIILLRKDPAGSERELFTSTKSFG